MINESGIFCRDFYIFGSFLKHTDYNLISVFLLNFNIWGWFDEVSGLAREAGLVAQFNSIPWKAILETFVELLKRAQYVSEEFHTKWEHIGKTGCLFLWTKTRFVAIVWFPEIGLHIRQESVRFNPAGNEVVYVDHEKVVKVLGCVTTIMTTTWFYIWSIWETFGESFFSARMRWGWLDLCRL